MTDKMTVGSCFSGIGGLELGLEWTGGFETKWQIEMDDYATKVLEKHWPNVKRYSDIRDVVRPEPVDLICGGFPCQDVSLAGKRAGLEGQRSTLWSEMFRLICEVKPRWVVAENVPGLLSSDDGRFFGNILRDLASIGYDAEWGVLSAAGVGAPHLRRRIFILAYPIMHTDKREKQRLNGETKEIQGINREENGSSGELSGTSEFISWANDSHQDNVAYPQRMERPPGPRREGLQPQEQDAIRSDAGNIREVLADAQVVGLQGMRAGGEQELQAHGREGLSVRQGEEICDPADKGLQNGASGEVGEQGTKPEFERSDWWSAEPDVGRVAHGISKRVDRLKCLGNAVVPQVAQKIGQMILDSQRGGSNE